MTYSMRQFICNFGKKNKDGIAIQYTKNKQLVSVTRGDFFRDIVSTAAYLEQKSGSIAGKHIAIALTYSYEYIVCMFAVMYADGVAIPCNILESTDILEYEFNLTDSDVILVDEKGRNRFSEGLSSEKLLQITSDCFLENSDVINEKHFSKNRNKNSVTAMLFTSGSCGRPKAVQHSSQTLLKPAKNATILYPLLKHTLRSCGVKIDEKIKCLLLFPVYHVGGLATFLQTLSKRQVTQISFDIKYIYKDIELFDPHFTAAAPTILKMWAKDLKNGKADKLGRIKIFINGAAPIDDNVISLYNANGKIFGNTFGMTELGAYSHININMEKYPNSVGKRLPGFKCKIRNGEVAYKVGKKYPGYYKMPDENEKTFREGWLYTEDLGYMDIFGRLYLTGRKKNLIILSSGENVSPEELEEKLYKCEYISEAVVREEEGHIAALIFAKEQFRNSISEYIDDVNKKLPSFKRITRVKYVSEPIPKNSMGKIIRDCGEK